MKSSLELNHSSFQHLTPIEQPYIHLVLFTNADIELLTKSRWKFWYVWWIRMHDVLNPDAGILRLVYSSIVHICRALCSNTLIEHTPWDPTVAHITHLPASSFSMYLACSLAADKSECASSMYSCNMLFSASSCSARECTSWKFFWSCTMFSISSSWE